MGSILQTILGWLGMDISPYVPYVDSVLNALGSLVLFSTFLVQIPGLSKYSDNVEGLKKLWQNLVLKLPVIGVHPQVKQMQELLPLKVPAPKP